MNKNIPTRVLGYKFIVKLSLISSGKGKSVFPNEVTLSTTQKPAFISYSLVGSDFSWTGKVMLLCFDRLGEILLFCLFVLK